MRQFLRLRILLAAALVGTVFALLFSSLLSPNMNTANTMPPINPEAGFVFPKPLPIVRPKLVGNSKIVGFFHFWYGDSEEQRKSAMDVFDDQIPQVLASYTYPFTSQIFVPLIGSVDGKNDVISAFTKSLKNLSFFHSTTGFEDSSLQKVHNYCVNNTEDIVWYIHNKGAWHTQFPQEQFRRSTTNFTLRQECLQQILLGYDVCSFRFTKFPHRHYPGNMWIARCSYIRTLPPTVNLPRSTACANPDQRNFSFVAQNGSNVYTGCRPSCTSFGRYYHEHWIGSSPYGNMSDCLGYSIRPDGSFHTYFAQYGKPDWDTIPVSCTAAPKQVLVDGWMKNFSLFPDVNPWNPRVLAGQRLCWNISEETDRLLFGRKS